MFELKIKEKILLVGMPCTVLNYRKRPAQWEPGIVSRVEIGVDNKGNYRISYSVDLERKVVSARCPWGRLIRLYVGVDKIGSIEY